MTDQTAGSGLLDSTSPLAIMLSTTLDVAVQTLAIAAPYVSNAGEIGRIIGIVGSILPIVVKEAKDLAPIISSTIAILRSNTAVTAEQLAALDAYEALIDADFDDALAFARANDAAVAAAAALKPATA